MSNEGHYIQPQRDLVAENNARAIAAREASEGRVAFLRRTHEGSTHWLGDDGYPACWRDHRECAEERVERLETALENIVDAYDSSDEGDDVATYAYETARAALTRVGK